MKRTSLTKIKQSPTIKKNIKIFSKLLKTTKKKNENSFSMSIEKESKENSENLNLKL